VTAERYTAVFTGHFDERKPGEYLYLTMSGEPLAPVNSILSRGRPPYESMGCEISFRDFLEGCQRLVLDIYRELWDL